MGWDVLDRLYDKGCILDPKNKNKSVVFTVEGFKLCKELFKKHFGPKNPGKQAENCNKLPKWLLGEIEVLLYREKNNLL